MPFLLRIEEAARFDSDALDWRMGNLAVFEMRRMDFVGISLLLVPLVVVAVDSCVCLEATLLERIRLKASGSCASGPVLMLAHLLIDELDVEDQM